jgi:hypothetical protein
MTAPEGRGAAGAGESGDTVRMAASEVPPAPGRRAGDRPMPRAIIDEAPPQSAAGPPAVAPPSTPAGGRSVPSEEAEPPPIPREELPAFAGGTQGQTPFWTVDPVTGEKVHEGPVELTFDGPVTPRRSAGPSVRLVAAAGAGAVVLAALVLSIYMRSRPGQTAPGPIADAGAPATIEPGRPSPDPRETTGAAADGTSVRTTEEPADAQGAAPAAAGAATNAPADRATPRGTTAAATPGSAPPEPEAPATAPPPAQRAAGVEADRLAPGRALLDAGDVSGAASAFASTLAAIPSDRIALHLMIACEEATVRKARAAVSVDDPLFVTPYAMRDRRCYRLLWGIYPDREAAALAASSVPAYFSGAGIKPVGVSIGRLRGSS